MEGIISIGSRVNAPHGRQDSDRSFVAKFPPVVVVVVGRGGGGRGRRDINDGMLPSKEGRH